MADPTQHNKSELAEYLFLLPQLLSVSPLIAVFRHINEYGEGADFVHSFRLITLAYMLMVTTLILFVWRPSIRRRHSFRRNLTRATCLGIVALVPVPLAMQILSTYRNLNVQLFSVAETFTAGLALLVCMAVNVACLVNLARSLPQAPVHRFDYLSFVINLIVVGMFIKWW